MHLFHLSHEHLLVNTERIMRQYRPGPDAAARSAQLRLASGMQQILSAATVTAVGLTCKAYLHSGLCSISVHGLPYLLDALYSSKRRNGQGQGILTGERVL
jgi:hypothetical protein